jgi:4-hydroxy-3-methylbut-2-enyl diphosphate reductase
MKDLGVRTVDDPKATRLEMLDHIDKGTVIITAHGASPSVFKKAKRKGLVVVDATCKDVYKTHHLIKEHLILGHTVVFIGKPHHPETETVLGLDDRIRLVETIEDAEKLDVSGHIFITNQTTFSKTDIEPIFTTFRRRFDSVKIADEICSSTRMRQEAVIRENQTADLCFVVGDRRSNNTNNLVKISIRETDTPTHLIESVDDIDTSWLEGKHVVTVTAGASTPSDVTEDVIDFLRKYDD